MYRHQSQGFQWRYWYYHWSNIQWYHPGVGCTLGIQRVEENHANNCGRSISKYGILIEQNYDGGDLDGTTTTGIPITDLVIKNIVGGDAVASSGYNIVIACGSKYNQAGSLPIPSIRPEGSGSSLLKSRINYSETPLENDKG